MTRLMVCLLPLVLLACGSVRNDVGQGPSKPKLKLNITSSAFDNGSDIPAKYTCRGNDVSPPLSVNGLPTECKGLAVLMEDPDAPTGNWVHWILYNVPPGDGKIPEAMPAEKFLADGPTQGVNDFRRIGYGGPCPPTGKAHRYVFKVYAVDMILQLPGGANKNSFLKAVEGHIVGYGELMGKFEE